MAGERSMKTFSISNLRICREAGAAEKDEIFLSLPFAPVHQLMVVFFLVTGSEDY